MNSRIYFGSLAAVVLAMNCAAVTRAVSGEPLRVTIEKTNGESTPAYLEKASERAILWKYTPEAATGNTMAREEIKSIEFEEPDDWPAAEHSFKSGAYEEAAVAFGMVAEKYKDIMLLEGNPASMAKYLEIESYRLGGEFGKLEEVLDEEALKILKVSLDEQFAAQLALNEAWAAATGENWDVVNQLIAEKSLPKEEKTTRTPEFKLEIPPRQMVQLAYMRGLSFDAAGDKDAALADYYRSFTLGFGNNRQLAGRAILKALAILAADPELSDKEEKLREIHSLAGVYKKNFGSGAIPEQFAEFAVPLAPEKGGAPVAPPPAKDAADGDGGKAEPEKAKAEDAKAKDAKAKDAKAEDAKAEDAKAEDAKAEDAKAEGKAEKKAE